MENLISANMVQKKCKLRLSKGKHVYGKYRICWRILQAHVNHYANAVITIFAFDFLLVCTFYFFCIIFAPSKWKSNFSCSEENINYTAYSNPYTLLC